MAALAVCRDFAERGYVCDLAELADSYGWAPFRAADGFLLARWGCTKHQLRRLLDDLVSVGVLEVVVPGDRKTPRVVRLLPNGGQGNQFGQPQKQASNQTNSGDVNHLGQPPPTPPTTLVDHLGQPQTSASKVDDSVESDHIEQPPRSTEVSETDPETEAEEKNKDPSVFCIVSRPVKTKLSGQTSALVEHPDARKEPWLHQAYLDFCAWHWERELQTPAPIFLLEWWSAWIRHKWEEGADDICHLIDWLSSKDGEWWRRKGQATGKALWAPEAIEKRIAAARAAHCDTALSLKQVADRRWQRFEAHYRSQGISYQPVQS